MRLMPSLKMDGCERSCQHSQESNLAGTASLLQVIRSDTARAGLASSSADSCFCSESKKRA
jgi:hypothetical protein